MIFALKRLISQTLGSDKKRIKTWWKLLWEFLCIFSFLFCTSIAVVSLRSYFFHVFHNSFELFRAIWKDEEK